MNPFSINSFRISPESARMLGEWSNSPKPELDALAARAVKASKTFSARNTENWHGNVINHTAGNLPPQTSEQQAAMITNAGLGTVGGFITGGPVGAFGGFWTSVWGTAADQSFGITPAVENVIRDQVYGISAGGDGNGSGGHDFGGWGGASPVSDGDSWF